MTGIISTKTEFIKAGIREAKQNTFTGTIWVSNSSMLDHEAQQRCIIWDQVTIFCDLSTV